MKKRLLTVAMAAMVVTTAVVTPAYQTWADAVTETVTTTQNQSDSLTQVNATLAKSAAYMMNYLENTISAEGYQMSYTDCQDAMYAKKAGAENEKVMQQLNAVLKEKLAAYDETFLNPYGSAGVQSLALASAILYLEEQGEDVTAYDGKNLVKMLEDTFLKEQEVNPYAYQYISAVNTNHAMSKDVTDKVKKDILALYVDNETGTGIDYWGVSADNNGQVLTALANEYGTDADVKTKADAALAWNKAQADASGAIVSWGAANSNSTAMAMRAAAQFGKTDEAAGYYEAMKQFASTTSEGAYTYAGEDSIFSSRDALTGLLAYRNALEGKDLFAVQKETEAPQPTEAASPAPSANVTESAQPSPTEETLPTQAASAQPSQTTAPKTGDMSNVGVLAAVMAASAAVITFVKGGKKEAHEQD